MLIIQRSQHPLHGCPEFLAKRAQHSKGLVQQVATTLWTTCLDEQLTRVAERPSDQRKPTERLCRPYRWNVATVSHGRDRHAEHYGDLGDEVDQAQGSSWLQ